MPIQENQIEVGFLYKTQNNQHRALIYIQNGNAIYATRGGNALNDFNRSETCSLQKFANDCCGNEGKIKPEELERIIQITNANRLLKKSEDSP